MANNPELEAALFEFQAEVTKMAIELREAGMSEEELRALLGRLANEIDQQFEASKN